MELETRLYRRRWLVAGVLGFLGCMKGFAEVFLGVINGTLSTYFGMMPGTVDWFSLSDYVGVGIASIPFALCANSRPLGVKTWFCTALLLQGVSLMVIPIVLIAKKYLALVAVAQIFSGATGAIFLTTIGLASVTWFSEREQATVYGIAWSAVSIGNLISALLPAIIFGTLSPSGIGVKIDTMAYIYAGFATSCFVILVIVWIFVPEFPALPPTEVESQRRIRRASQEKHSVGQSFRIFCLEIKALLKSRTLAFLVVTYALLFANVNNQYLLMPSIHENSSFSNGTLFEDDTNARRAYLLTSLAVGATLGGILGGMWLDRLKAYRPLAAVLSLSSFLVSIGMLICFKLRVGIGMFVFTFLFGASLSGSLPFIGEILKQHSYPKVSEVTQGIAVVILGCICQITTAASARAIIESFGDLYFFVFNTVYCVILGVLMLSINPTLNRFLAEERLIIEESYDTLQ